jgi:hypothetical protein
VQVSPVGWCRCDGLTATLEAAAVVVVVMVVLTKVFALRARRHLNENYCSCSYNAKKSFPNRPVNENMEISHNSL